MRLDAEHQLLALFLRLHRLGCELRDVRHEGVFGRDHGLRGMIAPVRPSRKYDYPLTPIERYIKWTRPEDELPASDQALAEGDNEYPPVLLH